jgi:hypothetical protein
MDGEVLSLTDFVKLASHVVLRHKEMVINLREEQRNGQKADLHGRWSSCTLSS